jgi:general secretion pathway protein D
MADVRPRPRVEAPLARFGTLVRRAVIAAILVAMTVTVPAGLTEAQDADSVTLNFVNADIDAVVKAVAEITGRNFIVDPRVKGTINIVSARPVPRSVVYPTLLSALRMQGFTAVESDGVVKIVPEADAKQQGGPVARGPVAATGDRLYTQVIVLRNESATQLVNVLRPLIAPNNAIAAYPSSNALVITDYADNLRRIERIVAALDQPPAGEPLVVPVKNASAIDLASIVNRVLTEGGGAPGAPPTEAQQRVVVIADPRSNTIIVRSDSAGRAGRVKQLIEQLDTPTRPGSNVYVVYLKNAEAGRVADALRGLYVTGGPLGPGGSPTQPGSPLQNVAAIPSTTASTMTTGFATSAAATSPLAGANLSMPGSFAAAGATIQADPASNSLIILAPEAVYNNLRAVIAKLDARRAQVYLEALIVEVTSDRTGAFGVQWQILTGAGLGHSGIQGVGGTNFGQRGAGTGNIIDASVNLGSVGNGLNVGLINGTITIPGLGVISNLALLVQALENDDQANILSTPTLLTLDNEEARIVVGQNIPIPTGSYATTGSSSTVQPFTTFTRQDVGVLLRVKPQITEGGTVKVNIYQEVSRVQDTSNTQGPTISKRALESSVLVDENQIIVLGGLIQDSYIGSGQKVPLLGDLPLLGALFRFDQRQRTKTNLLVFLKPSIVRSTASGRELTAERYDWVKQTEQEMVPEPRYFWHDDTIPELPPTMGVMPGTPGSIPLPPGWPLPPSQAPVPPVTPSSPNAPAPATPPPR